MAISAGRLQVRTETPPPPLVSVPYDYETRRHLPRQAWDKHDACKRKTQQKRVRGLFHYDTAPFDAIVVTCSPDHVPVRKRMYCLQRCDLMLILNLIILPRQAWDKHRETALKIRVAFS
jgi:hypothetical protein